eukprot:GHVU01175297.1.p2 GENE.GHVU01175297.1~~GHVU01175297.1.p2  ORF type:complete len:112 (-),score=11.00 GHVU01175297.1:744-1079(-)
MFLLFTYLSHRVQNDFICVQSEPVLPVYVEAQFRISEHISGNRDEDAVLVALDTGNLPTEKLYLVQLILAHLNSEHLGKSREPDVFSRCVDMRRIGDDSATSFERCTFLAV